MTTNSSAIRHVLRTTALCSLLAFLLLPVSGQAFDPNSGADATSKTTYTKVTRISGTSPSDSTVTYPSANAQTEALAAPLANAQPSYATALPPAVIPPRLGSSATSIPAPVSMPPAPVFPPVDEATQAAAARAMQTTDAVKTQPQFVEATSAGFIAPAPLVAPPVDPIHSIPDSTPQVPSAPSVLTAPPVATAAPHVQPIPVLQPMPTRAAPKTTPIAAGSVPVPPAEAHPLSEETQRILSKVPSKIGSDKSKPGKLTVSRMSPAIVPLSKPDSKVETYDAVGLSIKVQRPGLDSNFELNRAYTALMGGQTEQAADIYKNILSTEPRNEDALFGLGATYQRLGQPDKARPYYGKLLEVNPNHAAGLNNFLALVSEESPESALAELDRLEQRNPQYSAIPAQQALILNKLGYTDRAKEKMLRAIDLSPTNMAYRYNLAVLLDSSGNYPEAANLYRGLLDASMKGEKLPASQETIQKRLTFIDSAPSARGLPVN